MRPTESVADETTNTLDVRELPPSERHPEIDEFVATLPKEADP